MLCKNIQEKGSAKMLDKTWQKYGNSLCASMCDKHFPQIWVEHAIDAHDIPMDSYCAKISNKNVLPKCWTKPGRNMGIHHVQECLTNILQTFGWNIPAMPMTH
jgi:hypothetical protein